MQRRMNQTLGSRLGRTAALLGCAVAADSVMAQGAVFEMLTTEGLFGGAGGVDVDFEQRWAEPTIWNLVSGVDDGGDGIPNGLDSIIVDRSPLANGNTDLSNENIGASLSIAKLTGTGAGGGRDIVLKQGTNMSIGDLEILPSANPFFILEERDQPLEFTGIFSGSGDLIIRRNGSFSNGVQRVDPLSGEEEIITFTGTAGPSTYTGNLSLLAGGGDQPAYFVADKVAAFGEAASLTIESVNANSLEAELQITANTIGGEGAIDDDATTVFLGDKGVFNVDAGVDEVIGSGLLMIDILGSGTFTTVPDGTYNNTEAWIIGDGTITVGGGALPGDFDGDGDVDGVDIAELFANFTGPGGTPTNPATDLDGDGDTDGVDVATLFGLFTGPLAPATVPEPTSLALLGLLAVSLSNRGGLLIARRRR